MSGFVWTDRHGRRHTLDGPAAIETELAEVRRELGDYAADLEDEARWEAALAASEPLVARHNVLVADLDHWNAHVATINGGIAAEMVLAIDRLVADAGFVRLLHGYWVDQARAAMDRPPGVPASTSTLALVRAVALRQGRPEPAATSVGEIHAWVTERPESNRTPLGSAHPALPWVDRHGHAHQVRSLVEIEREQLALIGDLAALRPALAAATSDAAALAVALEKVRVAMKRLSVLQGDAQRWAEHVDGIRRQGARDRATEIRKMKG